MSEAVAETVRDRATLWQQYESVRGRSEAICEPLEIEDYVVQSSDDVSPVKWHIGHVTWFFEQVILSQFQPGYKPYRERFFFVFNSYYKTFGDHASRSERGTLSRPTVKEVYEYRHEIDRRMKKLFESSGEREWPQIARLIDIGLNHEQQHQELNFIDIKYNLATNPLLPAYRQLESNHQDSPVSKADYLGFGGGIIKVGANGSAFAYDNETPRHQALVHDFSLMDRLVTCGEFLEFIEDGCYTKAELWLSDAWAVIGERNWQHPLYWSHSEDGWQVMTLGGLRKLSLAEPVCHLSFYEAAAFARWAGKRLPTEFEWERAAQSLSDDQRAGNFVENDILHPSPADTATDGLKQMLGDCWEWTLSSYLPYPGYKQERGALGEYNGKFMCDQMVLRGGSCVTPRSHIRISYRNFFQADKRWPMTGLRLASDK